MSEKLDYENILCDTTHKHCSVPQKTLTKLKMFSTIAALTTVVIITFSGCKSIKEDITILTTTQQTTTCATTIEETTTNKYVEEVIINPTKETKNTTQKISVTTSKPKTTEPTTEKVVIQTTTKENIPTTTEKQETTKQPENIDNEYNKLREKLDEELKKKSFSDEVNKLFIDTFNSLYKNYPTWKNGYLDMPTREEYIKNNLISIIADISKIYYYDRDSKEAQELLDNGSPAAWTEADENNNPCIGIIAKKNEEVSSEERKNDIEKFFHEIIHCKQMGIMLDYNYFEENRILEQIIIEGGATFHMKYTNPYTTEVRGMWSVSNEKGDRIIDYTKDNGLGYLVELNVYEKLVYLTGYKTMDKIEQGKEPLSNIQKTIANIYGEEQANNFLQKLGNWYELYNTTWKGEEIYNSSIELEKIFLDFIRKDIENLETKQDLEQYRKKYKRYIEKNLPEVRDKEYNNHEYEIFEIDKIDSLIEEKLEQNTIKSVKKEIEEER